MNQKYKVDTLNLPPDTTAIQTSKIERVRELRNELMPLAEQQNFLTDEDVFKAIS